MLTYDEISGIFTRPGGGKPMTEEEAMAWVEKYDKSGDGTLDLDEFAAALAAVQVEQAEAEWREAAQGADVRRRAGAAMPQCCARRSLVGGWRACLMVIEGAQVPPLP